MTIVINKLQLKKEEGESDRKTRCGKRDKKRRNDYGFPRTKNEISNVDNVNSDKKPESEDHNNKNETLWNLAMIYEFYSVDVLKYFADTLR